MPPPLETTPPLTLRLIRPDDAPLLYREATSDPATIRYTAWRFHQSVAETEALVDRFLEAMARDEKFYYVAERAGGEPVGFGTLKVNPASVEIGFVIAAGHRRRGYAVEVIRLLSRIALARPGIRRLEGVCDTENLGSALALERGGFRREARLDAHGVNPNIGGPARDLYRYVLETAPGAT